MSNINDGFIQLFNEALSEYQDFESTESDDNYYYHFFTDFQDLLNALMQGRIYSDKNQGKVSQRDLTVEPNTAFVCMTNGKEGKKWVAKQYKRPFGLAFSKNHLEQLCKTKNYLFNPEITYNQFGEKSVYTDSARGEISAVFANTEFSDFEIFAIGELDNGTYFISGGQGPGNLWPAQVFHNEELYKTLKNWFLTNINKDDANKEQYYWFKDSTIGDTIQQYTDKSGIEHIITTTGNLNKNYRPREDTKNTQSTPTYERTIAFETLKNAEFTEIIGVGPINLSNYALPINLTYCNPRTRRGYAGPNFFGKKFLSQNNTTQFQSEPVIAPGRITKGSYQYNLIADENTYNALCEIYNEHEYRIYIPTGKDMHFDLRLVDRIILPKFFKVNPAETINIETLATYICLNEPNSNYNTISDDSVLANKLVADGVIDKRSIASEKTKKNYKVSSETARLVRALTKIFLLVNDDCLLEIIGNYKDILYTDNNNFSNRAELQNLKFNQQGGEFSDNKTELPDSRSKMKSSHTRYILNNVWPDFNDQDSFTEYKWKGKPSITGMIQVFPSEPPVEARLGSQTIVTGKDENGKKYVLFVDKVRLTNNFFELPGGGLYRKPTSPADFDRIARQRLAFKAGIVDDSKITTPKDTGKALLLYEVGTALDKTIEWDFSYYRLYTANYLVPIKEEDLDYQYDNREQAAKMQIEGEDGYTAYLKWIPVDDIGLNNAIVRRYSNIIDLIQKN